MNLSSDPIESSKDDLLNRKNTTDFILRLVTENDGKPLRLGLFGPWGSGKSSIIHILKKELFNKNENLFITFRPWVYSSEDDVINGFNTEVFFQIKIKFNKDKFEAFKKGADLLSGIVDKLNFEVEKLGTFGVAAGQIGNFIKSILINEDTLKGLIEETRKKVFFVIEDIDRCKPECVEPFLLYIREVLNLKNVVTIFVSDFSSLSKAHGLSSNNQGFFEKIYDYAIFLDSILPGDRANFLLSEKSCPFPADIMHKYSALLPDNPRTLKKFARNFTILKKETDRYYADDINFEILLLSELINLKYASLASLFIEDNEFLYGASRDLKSKHSQKERSVALEAELQKLLAPKKDVLAIEQR